MLHWWRKQEERERTWLHIWSKCEFSCGFQCPTCKGFSPVNPGDSCLQKPWSDSRAFLTQMVCTDRMWFILLKPAFSKCAFDTRTCCIQPLLKTLKLLNSVPSGKGPAAGGGGWGLVESQLNVSWVAVGSEAVIGWGDMRGHVNRELIG